MENNFKSKLKKLILILLCGYVLLFAFRLIYGYKITDTEAVAPISQMQFFDSVSMQQKNYASKKYKSKDSVNAVIQVDQKYEKIADIKTKSENFDDEEKLTREKIESYSALLQFEQKSGNAGRRNLSLVIGVPPENFENLYQDLSQIGKVVSKQITQKDKTNEYKQLNAEKTSLEKTRASLIELKSKGGKIEEYMELESRILDIEQQLQSLGVNLGDFDSENEFCTIQFSLMEGKETKISFSHRVKIALEWSIKYYLRIIIALFFVVLFAYLILVIIEKLKIIEKIVNK